MALIAHDLTGQRVAVGEAVPGAAYTCPDCGWRMAVHAGAIRTRHFAHYPGAPACSGTAETDEHRALKTWLAGQFTAWPGVQRVELEWRLVDDQGVRRADLWLETRYGSCAVECQRSAMTVTTLRAKLADYTRRGAPCLYILPASVFPDLPPFAAARAPVPVRPPAWVQELHALYAGRLYIAVPHPTAEWTLERWSLRSGRVGILATRSPIVRGDLALALAADPASGPPLRLAHCPDPARASAWPGLAALPAADYAAQYATATQAIAARGQRTGVAGVQAHVATIQQDRAALWATEAQRWTAIERIWTLTAEQAAGEAWLADHPAMAAPSQLDNAYSAWQQIQALDQAIQRLDRRLGPRQRRLGEAMRAATEQERTALITARQQAVAVYQQLRAASGERDLRML